MTTGKPKVFSQAERDAILMEEKAKDTDRRKIVKVDLHGTRHYQKWAPCHKCGGSGHVPHRPDNGVCWSCGGSGGWHWAEVKVYTDEYAKFLEDNAEKKRQAKLASIRAANRARFLADARNGFSADGITHVFLGETYAVRDHLRECGARYCFDLGWHGPAVVDGIESIEVKYDEVVLDAGRYASFDPFACAKIKSRVKMANERKVAQVIATSNVSPYIGNPGDRLDLDLEFAGTATFQTSDYMTGATILMFVHKFRDAEGHVLVWKTQKDLELDGEARVSVHVRGTVKEHKVHNGVPQTILSRCKIVVAA